ncbi:MAG: acyl carrier protein [Polyangiales bacterium]
MDQSELKESLRALIADIIEVDPSKVEDNTALRDLGVDSMQAIEIISDLERRYQIRIPEADFKRVTNLQSVTELLAEKLAARGA